MAAYFTPALFTFLRDLKAHNKRDWFLANRERYTATVEAPMLAFIGDLAPKLRAISSSIVVDPRRSGGSMYRIYRDTRFSSDKSPYKTHVAAHFAHERKKDVPSGVPGFYLHLEPKDCLGGGGIYHPDSATLARIRLAIAESRGWAAVRKARLTIEGERLTRAPAGFDPTHRYVDDLKYKDFYAIETFSQKDVCASNFLDRYVECCRRVTPLVAFIARALEYRW